MLIFRTVGPTIPRNVILIEGVPVESWKAAESNGLSVWDIHCLEADGALHPSPHFPPSPDDVAMICYTSGSTGGGKGVMLTHVNIISRYASTIACKSCDDVTPDDIYVSYMPLPHIFEHHVRGSSVITRTVFIHGSS